MNILFLRKRGLIVVIVYPKALKKGGMWQAHPYFDLRLGLGMHFLLCPVPRPRVLTRILKIGVKILFARTNRSFTILFYWHF